MDTRVYSSIKRPRSSTRSATLYRWWRIFGLVQMVRYWELLMAEDSVALV